MIDHPPGDAADHAYEEHKGGSHAAALERGPDTALPVSEPAREMLRQMRDGWRGKSRPTPSADKHFRRRR